MPNNDPKLSPRLTLALAAWDAGVDLKAVMSRSAFYRTRQELLAAVGVDVGKRKVMPRRTRKVIPVLARPKPQVRQDDADNAPEAPPPWTVDDSPPDPDRKLH